MVLFERTTFLTGVIAAQSRNMPAKLKASPQIGGFKKKVTVTIFGFRSCKSNHWCKMGFYTSDLICMSVAVSFFLTPLIFGDGAKPSKYVDFEQQ